MTHAGGAPHPYIPHTDADRAAMLARLGLRSTAQLFDALPQVHRDPPIELPPALSEPELQRLLRVRASENRDGADRPHFLGAGAYRRFVPAIVPYLVSRSEFMTAYTPYQPEISQGTLQAAFEFQSVVCALTGMDVANAGLYDVASATAEACLLAARVTGRAAIALLEPIHAHTVDVVRAYAFGANLRIDLVERADAVGAEHACLVGQQPDFLGAISDIEAIAVAAHAAGALCVVVADPFALGMLRAPGDAGADIVTGEGRDLAGPTQFGGPSLGLFAARDKFLRQLPGRIVGRTRELHGDRTGYVLTLQAREQFIRRERATSNISTGQSLLALAFTITVHALGPRGLREAATLCYQRAHDAARRVDALPGYSVAERGSWFQEFLVRGPLPAAQLHGALAARGITAGLDVSDRSEPQARDALLFAVTESTPPEHIERLIDELRAIAEER